MAALNCVQPQTGSTNTILRDVNSNPINEPVSVSKPSFLSKAKRRLSKLEICLIAISLLLLSSLVVTAVFLFQSENESAYEDGPADKHSRPADAVQSLAQILGNMDSSADPCKDFYQYACGGWLKKTFIDDSDVSVFPFKQVQKQNRRLFKEILENQKLRSNYSDNPAILKVFDMYTSCMNTSAIEKFGDLKLKQLLHELAVYNISKSRRNPGDYQWHDVAVKVKRRLGVDTFFKLNVFDDIRNSSILRIVMRAVDLGLDHESYTAINMSKQIKLKRESYLEYMTDLMALATSGNHSFVRQEMKQVLNLESEIAKMQLPPQQRGNFSLIYNLVPIEKLTAKASQLDWMMFFRNLTVGMGYTLQLDEKLIVSSSKMVRGILDLLNATDARVMSNFIAWKIVSNLIDVLPSQYEEAHRKYRSRVFASEVSRSPRWMSCVESTSSALSLPSALLFTERVLPSDTVEKSKRIVRDVREALLKAIPSQSWMDKKSQDGAIEKAKAIIFHIAYPDNISSTSSLKKHLTQKFDVSKSSYFTTTLNVKSYKFMEEFKSLKTSVDRTKFEVSDPLTPNAWFYQTRNKLEVTAGFLRESFYNEKNYKSFNYGALGMIVGHEASHGYDLIGHAFDKNGRQQSWMSRSTAVNLSRRTHCLQKQYSGFNYEGLALRGSLGHYREAFVDTGGLKLAFEAYKQWKTHNIAEPIVAGLNMTHDQLFFLSYAQMWCAKYREQEVIKMIRTTPYFPSEFRVRGTVMNSLDFARAFSCPEGSAMNPRDKCEVW